MVLLKPVDSRTAAADRAHVVVLRNYLGPLSVGDAGTRTLLWVNGKINQLVLVSILYDPQYALLALQFSNAPKWISIGLSPGIINRLADLSGVNNGTRNAMASRPEVSSTTL